MPRRNAEFASNKLRFWPDEHAYQILTVKIFIDKLTYEWQYLVVGQLLIQRNWVAWASRCPVENLGRTNRSNGGNTMATKKKAAKKKKH